MSDKNLVIFEHEYHGFESIVDLEEDVSDSLDARFNKKAERLPGEFQGVLKVVISYTFSAEEIENDATKGASND